ncbi:MAG: hemerythrin domain-containing protein [Myxococcales bacterium]|nr:hemerythrin domain-containing protein [Myxococcales bacterium]
MNILTVIRSEHDVIRSITALLLETRGTAGTREQLWFRLKSELLAHAWAEEAALYARLASRPATSHMARHSIGEHRTIDELVAQLDHIGFDQPPGSPPSAAWPRSASTTRPRRSASSSRWPAGSSPRRRRRRPPRPTGSGARPGSRATCTPCSAPRGPGWTVAPTRPAPSTISAPWRASVGSTTPPASTARSSSASSATPRRPTSEVCRGHATDRLPPYRSPVRPRARGGPRPHPGPR